MADAQASLDADSLKALEFAKKGKAHKFVLLCKGVKIQTMTIFRKGQPASMIKKAKQAGFKGQAYAGLVTGKGMDISFDLAKSEGYEDVPTKDLILKDFLKTAGFVCKPAFRLVDTLAELSDEEDEAEGSESTPDAGAEFTNRLKAIKPDLERVLAAQVPASAEAKRLAGEAAEAARQGDFDAGLERLDLVEQAIEQGLQQMAVPPSAPPPPPGNPGKEVTERVKQLMPSIKAVTESPRAEQLKDLAMQVAAAARDKDFVAAHRLLDEIETSLRESGGSAPSGPAPAQGASLSPDFEKAWTAAKSDYLKATETVNQQLEKLRSELQKSADQELQRIAELGLNAVTGDHRVPMQAAIIDVDGASADTLAKAIGNAREMVSEFRDHLDTDEQVEVCDDNPFEIKVAIRKTLDPALSRMEQVLANAFAG